MFLQSKDDHVVLLGLTGLLVCLMQGVPHVEARFTFELDLQSSSTTGSCDTFDLSPGCETYFRFCLRGSTSGQSRNIDDCPLGSHGRVDESNLPFTVSISSNSAWPRSFQLYIKAIDDDSPLPPQDLDFIFINSMLQPLQGYSSSTMVTGDNRRVTVTLRYRVRCQDGYYGQDCNSVCGANQHCYSNGTRECVSGWQSPDTSCNTPICRTGCHLIGGNCSTPFQCECNEGWRGDLCDQCIPAAGCSEVGGFCEVPGQCLCREGFGPPGVCNEYVRAPSPAAIAGIIVGCLVVLLIILSVSVILPLFLVIRKRRHNKLTNSASPSESANFYSNTAGSTSPKSYELTAAATTPTSDDGNHLEALVTNPLYGDPTNPTQLSDSAVISTNVPQTSLSPGTLHKVDNPLYGDPTEKPTDIYSEPTIIQYGGSANQTEPYAYTRMENKGSCHGNTGTQTVNQYNYATTTGDTSPSSTVPYHPYHTLQHIKETPPPVRMSKREGAGYEALQN